MADKFFISDTHFFHENIIQFSGRPFANADLMNEYMIEEWNKRVKPQDKVYHLGDVGLGFKGEDKKLDRLLKRLNGHKRLIVGNHDNLKSPALHGNFEKIELWMGFKEEGFTCVHIPLPLGQLRDGHVCVHGHLHNNVIANPGYINMCVEHTDYAPYSMDDLLKEVRREMGKLKDTA